MSCQKQSHLYVISTLNPHFLILKALSFLPYQGAYWLLLKIVAIYI